MILIAQSDSDFIDFDQMIIVQKFVTIDTVSNPNNSWQVGAPKKEFLSDALSLPNVIITDTINPYPVNDSSVFIISHEASYGFTLKHSAELGGYYKVDTDSLNDFGKIEFSPDNGNLWVDLLHDTIYPFPSWTTNKPVLTGTSDWTEFLVNLAHMGFQFDYGDTVLFRFTFISDDIENNRDGLMFDNLAFYDYTESIFSSNTNDFDSRVFPNPGNQMITIEFDNNHFQEVSLNIFDVTGKLMYDKNNIKTYKIELDISKYTPGIYLYRICVHESNSESQGKFVVR